MPPPLSKEKFAAKLNAIDNGTYRIIGEFLGNSKPMTVEHTPCGSVIRVGKANAFLNEGKCRCKVCNPVVRGASTKPITVEQFLQRLTASEAFVQYSYVDGFVGTHHKCKFLCQSCKKTFMAPAMMVVAKKTGCPHCVNSKRGKYMQSPTYLTDLLKDRHDGEKYKWLESYKGDNKIRHWIRHECGHEYEARPNDFQQGYGCPRCHTIGSGNGQHGISRLRRLLENRFEFSEEVSFGTRCMYIAPLRFDIHVHSLNLIIEYDGWQHFEPRFGPDTEAKRANFKTTVKRDRIKNEFMRSSGFNFLRIPYTLSDQSLKELIDVIAFSTMTEQLTEKFDVLFKEAGNTVFYNEYGYYTRQNCDYFKEV